MSIFFEEFDQSINILILFINLGGFSRDLALHRIFGSMNGLENMTTK